MLHSAAQPTYHSAQRARGAGNSDAKYTTLLDYVVCPEGTEDLVSDVYVKATRVNTDHRAVVAVLGADQNHIELARLRSAALEVGAMRPALVGVLHSKWREYGRAVNAALRLLRRRFMADPAHLAEVDTPRTLHLTRAQLTELHQVIVGVLKRHMPAVQAARTLDRLRPPSEEGLRAARGTRRRTKHTVRRLRWRYREAQRRRKPLHRQAAIQQQLAAADAADKEALSNIHRAEEHLAERQQAYRHNVVRTALYSANRDERHQKFAHQVLMASAPQGPRHGAGLARHLQPLLRPDGTLAETDSENVEVLAAHFAALGDTRPRPTPQQAAAPHPPTVPPPPAAEVMEDDWVTTEEVAAALARQKYHKAPGTDRVTSTMLRSCSVTPLENEPGDEELVYWLAAFFNEIRRQDWVPQGLLDGVVTMVPKPDKDDYSLVKSYRSITVLTAMRKVLEQVLTTRIMAHSESLHRMGEEQAGYRQGRGCVDQLFLLTEGHRVRQYQRMSGQTPAEAAPDPARVLLRETGLQRGPQDRQAHVVFLDLATAFDMADWQTLFGRLHTAGITGGTASMLRAIYRGHRCKVKVGKARSKWIHPLRGVPQGAISSPLLFLLYMAAIVAEVKKALRLRRVDMAEPLDFSCWPEITINADGPTAEFSGPLCVLLLADDLTILAHSDEDMDLCVRAVAKALHLMRAQANQDKSVHLVAPGQQAAPVQWYTVRAGELHPAGPIEQHTGHRYLGVQVKASMDYKAHRKKTHAKVRSALGRVGAETRTYGVYDPRLAAQTLHHAYSAMLYASEVWSAAKLRSTEVEKTRRALAQCAARALKLSSHTCHDFLLGELGFATPAAKLAAARLAYWFQLIIQPDHHFTRHMYTMSLATCEQGYTRQWVNTNPVHTWCAEVRDLLYDMRHEVAPIQTDTARLLTRELQVAWAGGDPLAQWHWLSALAQRRGQAELPPRSALAEPELYWATRRRVRELAQDVVAEWAQECWRASVATHPSLRWYAALHPNLTLAAHLHTAHDVAALHLRVRLRANVYPLEAVKARRTHRHSDAGYAAAVQCRHCGGPEAENLPHFLLRCPSLAGARGDLLAQLRRLCTHRTVRALIPAAMPPPGGAGEDVLLALMLGGDLSHHPGLSGFMCTAGEARRVQPTGRHPSDDRREALRAMGTVLRRLDEARAALERARNT